MHKEHLEAKIKTLLSSVTEQSTSPIDALENPGFALYCTLVDTIKLYITLKGKEPKRIHLTQRQEVLLADYFRKEGDIYFCKKTKLLGMRIIRGASSFSLE